MYLPPVPMTTPSSTSQSVFTEPRGISTSSSGPHDGGGPFVEDDRLGRDRGAGFGGVVGVVQADADELAGAADAGAEAQVLLRRAGDEGERGRVKGGEALQGLGRQGSAADVGHMGGKVADLAVCIEKTGFLGALGPVAQQFHGKSFA